MQKMIEVKQEHCVHCVHWHKRAANPHALSEVRGDCRHSPPSATTLQGQSPTGGIAQMVLVSYPVLPPEWPACYQFIPRAKLEVSGES